MIATAVLFCLAGLAVALIAALAYRRDLHNHRDAFVARGRFGTDYHRWITDEMPEEKP